MAEDLLDDADVYALLNQKRGCCMAAIVDPSIADAGPGEEGLPLSPVVPGIDRSAVRLGEEDVVVLPG